MKINKISSRQKKIIIGKLLGDGHLETQTKGKTYRLKIEHSYHQKKYVDWLYKELKSIASHKPRIKFHKRGDKIYKKYWFNSRSSPSLRFYAQQFYQDGKKIVPKLIKRWLDSLVLAIWFMDDGSVKSRQCQGRFINTQGFQKKEVNQLQNALLENFGLITSPRKQREGRQIYIPASERGKLKKIIQKHILPSMRYKL